MGKVICAGLGPGDPDLMSVKSDRTIRGAKHLAFFRKKGRAGQARTIVKDMLREDVIEYPMEYPVTTELRFDSDEYRQLMVEFYAEWADRLAELAQDHEVVVLCEGDPFFYGSFMHIYTRVMDHVPVEVVPAITGMSGAWTATGAPITWGDDVLTVLMGTLEEDKLTSHIAATDALVIMKIGTNFEKVIRSLKAGGKFDDAFIVQFATMGKQSVCKLSEMTETVTPYFSIIVVHGQGRRP